MEAIISALIPAIVENVFGALSEAVGLSDWLRQRLGCDPEKLAFQQALTQALTDSATQYPGRDLRYFAEILRDIGGPLLARTLQPVAPLPTADELTTVWLNHLTVDSLIHYRAEFTQFATYFLDRLQFHLENQQPLRWIAQARHERSSEEAMRHMADAAEQSAIHVEALRQEVAHLTATLATVLQTVSGSTVTTGGGAYIGSNVSAQNFAGRDLTIKNYFVAGLPRLVIDYSSRIQDFLLEYLGSKRKMVPFGGRQQQLAELNTWLDDPTAPPYYLMTAEAGRGKSALVCRWLAQLTTRPDLDVIFVPISIRFETATQDVVFAALSVRLAKLYGEDEQLDLRSSAEQWKATCQIYLRRTLPYGKKLLVILDGLDEATGWSPTRSLFSADPPDCLRILVTARTRPGESGVGSWSNTLGWDNSQLAQATTLQPLERRGVEEALVSMGNPLSKLATQLDVVGELHRLSEGDPLLVRLYVDALVAQQKTVHQLSAKDLQSIQPGLAGYFTRWWSDQQEQWRLEGSDPIVEQANLRILLNAIAAAMGPVTLDDLAALHPNLTDSMLVRRLSGQVNRWLVGDGKAQGYSFSHPRLGYYFWEQLGQHEQKTWDVRFCNWGERVLVQLNSELSAFEQTSPYLLQHYATHLDRAGATPAAFYALVSNGWRKAWEVVDVSYGGFLNDVEQAWQRARNVYNANRPGNAESLVQQVRAALCHASIVTLNTKIPSKLLIQLVIAGLQTLPQAFAVIKLVPEINSQADMLLALVTHLPPELFRGMIDALADTFSDKPYYPAALRILAERLPPTWISEIFVAVDNLKYLKDRADILCRLAPHLATNKIEEALTVVRVEYRYPLASRDKIRMLAPYLSVDQIRKIFHDIYTAESRSRSLILSPLMPHLPVELREEALALVCEIKDEKIRIEELIELAPYLTSKLVEEILVVVQSGNTSSTWYRQLLPYIPMNLIKKALVLIRESEQEWLRSEAIAVLAPRLPISFTNEALMIAYAITNVEYQIRVLIALAPYLPEHEQKSVLNKALFASREIKKVDAIIAIALLLPADAKRQMLYEALLIVRAVESESYRADIMIDIALYLPPTEQVGVLKEALATIRTINYERKRADTLIKIIPHLSEDLLKDAISIAYTFADVELHSSVLIAFGPYCTSILINEVLHIGKEIEDKLWRINVLSELAPYLPVYERIAVLKLALTDARVLEDTKYRAFILSILINYISDKINIPGDILSVSHNLSDDELLIHPKNELSPPLPALAVEGALYTACGIVHEAYRIDMLTYLVRHLVAWAKEQQQEAYLTFTDILPDLSMRPRAELLRDLAALMPFILALAGDEAPQAAEGIYQAIQDVCGWWP